MSAFSRFSRLCFVLCVANLSDTDLASLEEIGEKADILGSIEDCRFVISEKRQKDHLNGQDLSERLKADPERSELLNSLEKVSPGAFFTRFMPGKSPILQLNIIEDRILFDLDLGVNCTAGLRSRVQLTISTDENARRFISVKIFQVDENDKIPNSMSQRGKLLGQVFVNEAEAKLFKSHYRGTLAEEGKDLLIDQERSFVLTSKVYVEDPADTNGRLSIEDVLERRYPNRWLLRSRPFFRVEEFISLGRN